ncbi:hypothetical protein DSL72_008078 [Monilinia vaccinii-corymbosi]|uniref:Uncharacterized protein n=1 Tax=Monilinia vaccinii-corymbosi TaxID=61207 RepID=A0A8A3PJS5_9HELO|nr:hypothetical protein DSL72_008078 [Monilinia vaccinii-corymbosi]
MFYDDYVPEELLKIGNYAALFLRCRHNHRDRFKQGLSKYHQQKIQCEQNRIAELQGIFAAQERNDFLLSDFKDLKEKWQEAAKTWGSRDIPDDSGYGFSVSKIALSRIKTHRTPADKALSFDSCKTKRRSLTEVVEPNSSDPWKLDAAEN